MYDQSKNLRFYLNDHLGSARMVIDSTGTMKDTYKRYYAFGDAAQQTVSTGQRFRYTGKPFLWLAYVLVRQQKSWQTETSASHGMLKYVHPRDSQKAAPRRPLADIE